MSLVSQSSPSMIGPHRVLAKLGEGRLGDAYLIRVNGTPQDRELAVVKELRAELLDSSEFVRMLVNHVRRATRLDHPRIVQIYGVSKHDGRLYVASDYVDGEPWSSARDRLRVEGPPGLHQHLKILADSLAALQYAHELQILHCAINPRNVFLSYRGDVQIADFGAAAALVHARVSQVEQLACTLAYAAPEQVRGERVDQRGDLFSVGVMLWEALACKPLAPGTRAELMPIEDQAPNLPLALRAICARALALNPADRFATAAEFRDEILRYLAETSEPRDPNQPASPKMSARLGEHAQLRSAVGREMPGMAPPTLPLPALPPPPLPAPLAMRPPPMPSAPLPAPHTLPPPPLPQLPSPHMPQPPVMQPASPSNDPGVALAREAAAAEPTRVGGEANPAVALSSEKAPDRTEVAISAIEAIGAVRRRGRTRALVLAAMSLGVLLGLVWFRVADSPHASTYRVQVDAGQTASSVKSPRNRAPGTTRVQERPPGLQWTRAATTPTATTPAATEPAGTEPAGTEPAAAVLAAAVQSTKHEASAGTTSKPPGAAAEQPVRAQVDKARSEGTKRAPSESVSNADDRRTRASIAHAGRQERRFDRQPSHRSPRSREIYDKDPY